MKHFRLIILLLFLILSVNSEAQYWKNFRQEVYFGLGPSNYFGDIGGSADANNWMGLKDIQILGTRPSIYGGYKYKLTPSFAIRGNANISLLAGNDAGSRNEERDYAFNSTLLGGSVTFEYSIVKENFILTKYKIMNLRHGIKQVKKLMNIYVFGGAGYNYVKVFPNETLDINAAEDINPPISPSLDYDYALSSTALVFPIGGGFKFGIHKNIFLGFEGGVVFSLSDHLDGVTSVVSSTNDMYYFSNIHLIYKLYRKPRF